MPFQQKQNPEVVEIKTTDNFAAITCKIPTMIEIGESITTKPFDLTLGDSITKWSILFYPKGQYDFGKASKDCRVYLKMISCNNTYLIYTSRQVFTRLCTYLYVFVRTYTSRHVFMHSDQYIYVESRLEAINQLSIKGLEKRLWIHTFLNTNQI